MKRFISKVAASTAAFATAMQTAAITSVVYAQNSNITPISKPRGFAADAGVVINAVLGFVMVLASLLLLMYLVWGGIEWITSGGDKGKTEGARNKITAAVVGIIILAASYAIFGLVLNFLGLGSPEQIFTYNTLG